MSANAESDNILPNVREPKLILRPTNPSSEKSENHQVVVPGVVKSKDIINLLEHSLT